jgi:hypothetical protein
VTTTKTPQDRRPSTKRKVTKAAEAKQDAELDQGIAFTDDDGTRIQVRLRDVRGSHDAALVSAVGMDFMGLLSAFQKRQGLDLMAAIVWFGRLVNGRDAGSYEEVLDSFGYEDVVALDVDEATAEGDAPEA